MQKTQRGNSEIETKNAKVGKRNEMNSDNRKTNEKLPEARGKKRDRER